MNAEMRTRTPWQRMVDRFGSQSELARAINCDRSKISRLARDERGLINGPDQDRIIQAAKFRGMHIDPVELLPNGAEDLKH